MFCNDAFVYSPAVLGYQRKWQLNAIASYRSATAVFLWMGRQNHQSDLWHADKARGLWTTQDTSVRIDMLESTRSLLETGLRTSEQVEKSRKCKTHLIDLKS